jgi:hypothetical protein
LLPKAINGSSNENIRQIILSLPAKRRAKVMARARRLIDEKMTRRRIDTARRS